ncbi:MAG TPA: LysM peptidoglycan-binding domain-containing protein [Candidatus Limnocylindrales bacterium]
MTDRGLPIVDGAPACPFVAYEDDRDGRGQAPDHRHRCFAEARPAPRALAHQEAYCLSSAFPVCPTFQDWARREAATARALAEREEPPPEEPPISQPLPPRDAEPRHAPAGEPVPPLPPRRNPPRAWADPPPWAGDPIDEPAAPPPFLADRPPEPAADRSSDAAWGAASRGLAGSAADRLAGPYSDEIDDPRPAQRTPAAHDYDEVDAPDQASYPPNAYEDDPYDRPAAIPPTAPERPAAGPTYEGTATPSSSRSSGSRSPSGGRQPAAAPSGRRSGATPRTPSQDPSELFGPAWERPRRYEAYPSLRTRVGIPSIGVPSRIGVAAAAILLAAVGLFFIGPMLLGIGSNDPGGAGATGTPPAEEVSPSAKPTAKPDPTPQVHVVARGDTMLKIAKKYDVTVEQLLAANPKIKNPNRIQVGDEIKIPVPERDAGATDAP